MDEAGIGILQDSAMEYSLHQKRRDPCPDVIGPGVFPADFPQTGASLPPISENCERKEDE